MTLCPTHDICGLTVGTAGAVAGAAVGAVRVGDGEDGEHKSELHVISKDAGVMLGERMSMNNVNNVVLGWVGYTCRWILGRFERDRM